MKAAMQPFSRRRTARQHLRLRAAIAGAMVLAAALVGADALLWFRLEREMDHRLDRFIKEARAAGWHVSARNGGRGGWPLAATLTLQEPGLRYREPGPGRPPAFAWSGEAVMLSLSLWRPAQTTVVALGTQSLSIAPNGGMPMPLRFWGARIALLLPERGIKQTGRIALEAEALHVAPPGAGPDDVVEVAGASGRLRWTVGGKAGPATLSLALREVALPIALGRPEGRVVQRARLDAGLDDQPPGPLTGWLRPGVAIRLGEASLDWDDDRAALSGNAVLSPDDTPSGAFSLSVDDAGRLLGKLRDNGLLSPGTVVAAQAVAGLVGDAGSRRLHVPLQLHGGLLSLGEIPLLRLPALR